MQNIKLTTLYCFTLLIISCGGKQKPDASSADTIPHIAAAPADASAKTILFFGDSLTAGLGLDDPSTQAFPGVIAAKIDSLKLPYKVINAGVSGETTAGGLSRINWILKQKIDVFILELGANDGLRGTPVTETMENLQAIIDKVRSKYPTATIILLGMQVPPSMGATYAGDFKAIFPALATKNKISLVPFLLAGVGGNPKLNQSDGIHPTAAGAKILAGNVWKVLGPELSN